MNSKTLFVSAALALGGCSGVTSQRSAKTAPDSSSTSLEHRANTSSVTRVAGGSMRTPLFGIIALNGNTTLQREWITVHDTVLPMDFVGTPGIATTYKPGGEYSSGTYEYGAKFKLTAKDSVMAFEVRFVVFDVWGNPVRTLSETEIEDVPQGSSHDFEPQWNLYSENEASEYYASIAFVARVRTKSGKVVVANMDPILTEAVKFSRKFTAADLEPRAPSRP